MKWTIVLFFVALVSGVTATKLNLPRVLLPIFKNIRVNYTLEGVGCYKWSSTSLDIIEIQPIDEDIVQGCSSKAVVTAVARDPVRSTAVVLAEDVLTGQVIRADAIVDVISSLSIITTTRELYVEEPPEVFEVRAYDDQGNEFSTLEGVEFEWSLQGQTDGQVLRFITFRESPYETPESVAKFDAAGKHGHIVLLEGVRTGSVRVSVRLPQADSQSVPPDEVQLLVVANIIIDPSDATILPGDIVNYRVLQVKQGRLIEIKLPHSQYSLESEDLSIASINKNQVTGVSLGTVKLYLRDINFNVDDLEKLPKAILRVAMPASLSLKIAPFDDWEILSRQPATFITEVFDEEQHKFYLGKKVRITMQIPGDLFEEEERVLNGSMAFGVAAKPGSGQVISSLSSPFSSPELVVSRTLVVLPPIVLTPVVLALPWLNTQTRVDEFTLKASGGDGNYQWRTSKKGVVTVSGRGVVKPVAPGSAQVIVSMKNRLHQNASSQIFVLRPYLLRIIDYLNEAEVGQPIILYIALYGQVELRGKSESIPMVRCSGAPLQVFAEGGFEFVPGLSGETKAGACTTIGVIGKKAGRARVTVVLEDDHGDKLEASTMVAAFDPLLPLYPSPTKPAVLAVGSSRQIVFHGGPRPLFGKLGSSISADSNIIRYQLESPDTSSHYIVRVLCLKIGETALHLKVGLEVGGSDNMQAEATVPVICAQPFAMSLQVDMGPHCPIKKGEWGLAAIHSNLRLLVTVEDRLGNVFDNATSLRFSFDSDPRVIEVPEPSVVDLESADHGEFVVPEQHVKTVATVGLTGSWQVRARIVGYQEWLLRALDVSLPESLELVKASLTGAIVGPPVAALASLSLVHPTKEAILGISGGSGHFGLTVLPSGLASARHSPDTKQILVTPIVDGHGAMSIQDLCLPYPLLSINLHVIKVARLRLDLPDRLERGRKTTASIRFLDSEDKPLSLAGNEEADLELRLGSYGVVKVDVLEMTASDRSRGTVRASITGLTLGTTSLEARWIDLVSEPASILVFPALRLHPRNLTVAVGAEFQISVTGGPLPDAGLIWTVGDSNIAAISSIGLVRASRLGHTTVSVMAVGPESQVYSKDTVQVHVISLNKVRILAPLSRLAVGAEMPVVASGVPATIGPLVLGSIYPPLQFKWSLSFPGVVQLRDVFHSSGLELNQEDRLSMRLKALKPGRTTLFLTVSLRTQDRVLSSLNATMELDVVDRPHWAHPAVPDMSVLVAPYTSFTLKLTKDLDRVRYHVLSYPDHTEEGSGRELTSPSTVVQVNDAGVLRTTCTLGTGVIIADTPEAPYRRLPLVIQVQPVHYLMVNVVSQVNPDRVLPFLPRGLRLLLNVTYHDALGNAFFAAPSQVEVTANRLDRVQVAQGASNHTFEIGLENSGSTVLQFTDLSIPYTDDYLKLPIDVAITPVRSHMTDGEIVCFSSPFSGADGSWSSDNEIIAVDESGAALARKIGSSSVTFSLGKPHSLISTTLQIDVLPVQAIHFGPPSEPILTNAKVGRQLLVPVFLLNERHKKELLGSTANSCKGTSFFPNQFPFLCEIRFNSFSVPESISSVFSVAPTFDRCSGQYACSITALAGPSPNTSVINSNVTLRASIDSIHSESIILNFMPGILVQPAKLDLTSVNSRAFLSITGTPRVLAEVTVEPSQSAVLSLSRAVQSNTNLVYRIQLERGLDQPSFYRDLSLLVSSPMTGQQLLIPVSSPLLLGDGGGSQCIHLKADEWWAPFSEILSSYKLILVLATSILAAYLSYSYIRIAITPQSQSPLLSANLTDQDGSIVTENDSFNNLHSIWKPARYDQGGDRGSPRRSNLFT